MFHGIKQKGDPPDMWLWHRRLGHPSFEVLRKVFPNLANPSVTTKLHCDVCEIAKHHRVSYPSSENKSTLPFSIVHSDVWGPCRTTSIFGHRWFVTFIDEHTRHTWVYLMRDKSEVFSLFVTFYNMISNLFDTKIRILQSDQGREYVNNDFKKFFTEKGIIHHMSCVHTSPQNGLAKRKNRHLLNVTRSLLFTHNVPKNFWGDALLTAGYLINRLPSKFLNFQSPHEKLVSLFPSVRFFSNLPLKVFGCVAFVHNISENLGKLEPRATKCMFLGYSMSHKG